MKQQTMASKNPDIIASVKALRRAAKRALELGLSTGTPVYAMKAGNIVDLTKTMTDDVGREAPMAAREGRSPYESAVNSVAHRPPSLPPKRVPRKNP